MEAVVCRGNQKGLSLQGSSQVALFTDAFYLQDKTR